MDCPIQSAVELTSSQGFYKIVPAVTATTYRLTATPVVGGPQATCTAFTLTNTGVETVVGGLGDACWD